MNSLNHYSHLDEMKELVKNEIIKDINVTWDDIGGLDFVKSLIKEIIVWPMLRPDIFTGLRKPPAGLLLFGPPGTGKTLLGKCIASNSKATFFSITPSVIASRWYGDGEKFVRALFEVAKSEQPSVIFIDEVDSLLNSPDLYEHELSRRIKTEFFARMDGITSLNEPNKRILVVGATNRPDKLDEAARRRFVKRIYVPLPDSQARLQIIENLLQNHKHSLTPKQLNELSGTLSEGYSGADMADLCREASLWPIRTLPPDSLLTVDVKNINDISFKDFKKALDRVKPSVCSKELDQYVVWNSTFGCQEKII